MVATWMHMTYAQMLASYMFSTAEHCCIFIFELFTASCYCVRRV